MFTITVEHDDTEYEGEFHLNRDGSVELVRVTPPDASSEVQDLLKDRAEDKRHDWLEEVEIEHRHNSRD